ncbi:MAG TPA: methyltransferase domain-containing protein [Acidimicrobiales bacterium]|jgi:SAM-dependent methyltransferase|nr:methyltransferase domain-containing protein [Acidimicrobiales bacterium]
MVSDEDRLWLDSMAEAYDRWLGPAVFRPFAVDLAGRAGFHRPDRILELAAGTGILTRELVAVLPDAELVATDLNPAMVSLGSQRVPAARWETADAVRLPYPDGQFDLVACQFGVMFFPDKPAAYAEARRVLRPGGRLLFNTWDVVATHGFDAAVMAGLERAFPGDPPNFLVAVPHGYADREVVVSDLTAGGLETVVVETVTLEGHAESAAGVATGFCTGTPVRAGIEARSDLAAATVVVSEDMVRQLGPGPVTARMTAHVFEARPNR